MSDRTYRILLGITLLTSLFFNLDRLVYLLVIMMFTEGLTNIRLPMAVAFVAQRFTGKDSALAYTPEPENTPVRYHAEAERIWRIVVGTLLLITFYYYEQLWFFPWFMGFAIFGAGISGVCPMLLAIRWVGFK